MKKRKNSTSIPFEQVYEWYLITEKWIVSYETYRNEIIAQEEAENPNWDDFNDPNY